MFLRNVATAYKSIRRYRAEVQRGETALLKILSYIKRNEERKVGNKKKGQQTEKEA